MNCSGRFLSDASLSAILEGLQVKKTLPTSFLLDNNLLTDRGAASLAAALRNNPFLTDLDVSRNQLTASGVGCLAQVRLPPSGELFFKLFTGGRYINVVDDIITASAPDGHSVECTWQRCVQ